MRSCLRSALAAVLVSRAALADPSETSPLPAPTPAAPAAPEAVRGGEATTSTPSLPPPSPVPSAPDPAQAAQPSVASAVPAKPPASPLTGVARIRIAVDHPDAWLEARPFGLEQAWERGCPAPCGRILPVDGVELRVSAPGMTPSRAFRVAPGDGAALLRVDGGSATARLWGRTSFAVGVPLGLLGMSGFAWGSFDDQPGLRAAGAVSLGVGAALILVALPLLVTGTTNVKNDKGETIAAAESSSTF